MTGTELAHQAIQQSGTTDVFELARLAGVTVHYERWHPVTVGEYNKRTRTITINLAALVEQRRILAHELGHFFVQEAGIVLWRADEEKLAEAFAETLLTDPEYLTVQTLSPSPAHRLPAFRLFRPAETPVVRSRPEVEAMCSDSAPE